MALTPGFAQIKHVIVNAEGRLDDLVLFVDNASSVAAAQGYLIDGLSRQVQGKFTQQEYDNLVGYFDGMDEQARQLGIVLSAMHSLLGTGRAAISGLAPVAAATAKKK